MKVMKVKRKLKLKSGRKETDKPVEPKPDQCIVEEPEPLLVTIHDSMKPKHDPQSDETLPAENPQAEEGLFYDKFYSLKNRDTMKPTDLWNGPKLLSDCPAHFS